MDNTVPSFSICFLVAVNLLAKYLYQEPSFLLQATELKKHIQEFSGFVFEDVRTFGFMPPSYQAVLTYLQKLCSACRGLKFHILGPSGVWSGGEDGSSLLALRKGLRIPLSSKAGFGTLGTVLVWRRSICRASAAQRQANRQQSVLSRCELKPTL